MVLRTVSPFPFLSSHLLSLSILNEGEMGKCKKNHPFSTIFHSVLGKKNIVHVGSISCCALFNLSFPIFPHNQTGESCLFPSYLFPLIFLPSKIPQPNIVKGASLDGGGHKNILEYYVYQTINKIIMYNIILSYYI